MKRFLGTLFGPEWQERLETLAALRRGWRASGVGAETVARWSDGWVARQGWLPANDTAEAETAPARDAGRLPSARH